jgi:hypothetical protein
MANLADFVSQRRQLIGVEKSSEQDQDVQNACWDGRDALADWQKVAVSLFSRLEPKCPDFSNRLLKQASGARLSPLRSEMRLLGTSDYKTHKMFNFF